MAVVLEQTRGALIPALRSTDFIKIYPVHPPSWAKLRKALYPRGAKSDPADAELLEERVRQNPDRFRSWRPGDEPTRRLQLLTEGRRKFVEDRTALTNHSRVLGRPTTPKPSTGRESSGANRPVRSWRSGLLGRICRRAELSAYESSR